MRVYEGYSPNGVCSACFTAKPVTHVDFEAAWDGPVFRDALPDGTELTIPVQVDELILCAECIAEAATHVPDPRDPQIAKLRAERMVHEKQIGELEEQVSRLKAALAAEPEPEAERPRARKKEKVA